MIASHADSQAAPPSRHRGLGRGATDLLFTIGRKPRTWVVVCVAYTVLMSVGRLFALFALPWVIGSAMSGCCEKPTLVQRLTKGFPVYASEVAKSFGLTQSDVWVRFGESFVFSVCWLALAYFLLRHRPWARQALFVLLAVGAINHAVLSVSASLRGVPSGLNLGTPLFVGVLIFVFTRKSVAALFADSR